MLVRRTVDERLKKILAGLRERRAAQGSPEQMIRDFYASGMDMKRRNALGLAPLKKYLEKIEKAESIDSLFSHIPEFHRVGVDVLWSLYVDQDDKNSAQYVLRLSQAGLGMPEREYYLKDDVESLRVRNAYKKYVESIFRLSGQKKDAGSLRDAVLSIETILARASMKKELCRDPHKLYNRATIASLSTLALEVNWREYFVKVFAAPKARIIVSQPLFLKEVSRLATSASLYEWKAYFTFHVINSFGSLLSNTFVRQTFSFYGTVLTGTKSMKPLWRRVLGVVNGTVGELLGKIYVQSHFSEQAKKKMLALVNDLLEAYEVRLKNIEWMSPATKKKALRKLRALNPKIGYPDKWRSYRGLTITAEDYVGNVVRSAEFHHKKEMKKVGGPILRWEWHMHPHTVNAYFSPNLNDIVFPAGILEYPFFSFDADDALNYGAIGSVIAHEITHGFDDEGSKFDHKGNLKSWWTRQDRARFDKKAAIVKKQFDSYEVSDGVHVNGKLTLGENIADLGGVAIAYDAYQRQLLKTGRKNIDGFSPEERFFLGFSLFDREHYRSEYEKMLVLTDPHSPAKFRINGPLSNLEHFYKVYGVKKGDKLYRDSKVRTTVW